MRRSGPPARHGTNRTYAPAWILALLFAPLAQSAPPAGVASASAACWSGDDDPPRLVHRDFHGAPAHPVLRVERNAAIVVDLAGKSTELRLLGLEWKGAAARPTGATAELAEYLERVLEGESVFVEYESGEKTAEADGPVPAYVYRRTDGLLLNLEALCLGYAALDEKLDFQQRELFAWYEAVAQDARKGIWRGRRPSDARDGRRSESGTQARGQAEPSDGHESVGRSRDREARSGDAGDSDTGSRGKDESRDKGDEANRPDDQKGKPDDQNNKGDEPLPDGKVYVTKYGEKYHRAGCRFLTDTKKAVTLEEARKTRKPCLVCKPPK